MGWLSRYRHTRGFGVHSPFAYRFITEVIGEKYAFYDYLRLRSPLDQLIYRVAVAMQPQRVISLGKADIKAARMAVSCKGCPPVRWAGVESTEMAIATSSASLADLQDTLGRGMIIVLRNPSRMLIDQLLKSMSHGVSFTSPGGTSIIVPFERLPLLQLEINF